MKEVSNIPSKECDPSIPELFRWFFCGNWQPPYLCIQDAVHMVVKAFRALMTKILSLGFGNEAFASRSVLISLTNMFPKMIIGITKYDLTENKDNMNYAIAEKICAKRVTDKLTRPEEQATKTYLLLMRSIITAYIAPETTPDERIFASWYCAMFCRIWKESLCTAAKSAKDTVNATVDRSFISSNLHACMEINGHHTTLFHNQCRDMGRPELFLPHLTGSQPCEDKFRTLRSISTTRSTVVNFDTFEVLQKGKRLKTLDEFASPTDGFDFNSKKVKPCFVPNALLSDSEVNAIVGHGFQKAKQDFSDLRYEWNLPAPRCNIARNLIARNKASDDQADP